MSVRERVLGGASEALSRDVNAGTPWATASRMGSVVG